MRDKLVIVVVNEGRKNSTCLNDPNDFVYRAVKDRVARIRLMRHNRRNFMHLSARRQSFNNGAWSHDVFGLQVVERKHTGNKFTFVTFNRAFRLAYFRKHLELVF